MTLCLIDNLDAYRRTDTAAWALCAQQLSENVGAWAAQCLESTQASEVVSPELVDPEYISDKLLELLLAPELVASLLSPDIRRDRAERLRPKTERRARADLAEHVISFLTSSFLSGEEVGPAVQPDGRYLSFKLYSLGSKIPWLSEAVFGQSEVHDRICRVIDGAGPVQAPQVEPTESRIVRLDIIDPALYKALYGHPELLKSLDWRVFEKLLADLLEKLGYEIELQRGTKDGGVDLFAIKREDVFGPQRYLLQAKRWNHNVGVEPVRQLAFLHAHHKMTKSCLATTASFTTAAWELGSQYKWQLELRDFEGLKHWLGGVASRFDVSM